MYRLREEIYEICTVTLLVSHSPQKSVCVFGKKVLIFAFLLTIAMWHYKALFMMTSSNGNSFRVTGHLCGEFTGPRWIPTQRPVTRGFDVFFDLRPDKQLSKQSWGWWFETPSHSRLHRWSHPTDYNGCNYLSMLGLKLNHVSKSGSRNHIYSWTFKAYWIRTYNIKRNKSGYTHLLMGDFWNEKLLKSQNLEFPCLSY